MSRSKAEETRKALRNKHGLDTERVRADDTEMGPRERRGLQRENSKAFGGGAAGTIRQRVRGDLFGKKDT